MGGRDTKRTWTPRGGKGSKRQNKEREGEAGDREYLLFKNGKG